MMLKKLSVLSIAFSMVAAVYAGNVKTITISGSVIDDSGEPVAGAKVIVEDLGVNIYTDLDGNFEIKGVTKPVNSIKVSMISFEDTKSTLQVNNGNVEHLSIALKSK